MNVIPLFMSLFLMLSCNNQEQIMLDPVEKSTSKAYQEEKNIYLSAQQVFYAASLEKIDQLENQKVELIEKQEKGDIGAIKKIEYLQKEINKYKSSSEYFIVMKLPKGPKGPIGPIPPVPCFNEKSNCNPKIKYTKAIVIGENDMEVKVEVVSSEGEIVGKGEMGKGEFGLMLNLEVKPFISGVMKTNIYLKGIGSIELDIPVRY